MQAAVEDASGRVLPSLGESEAMDRLRPALRDVASALASGDVQVLRRATLEATAAIEAAEAGPGANAANLAELSAVRLVLDQVEVVVSPAVKRPNSAPALR